MLKTSSAIKEILSLLQQKVATLYSLYTHKKDELELLNLDKQDLLTKISALEADKLALVQVVSQKTEESLNLATQVASLNAQYNTSQAAQAYAAEQKVALTAEVEKVKADLAAAVAIAAEKDAEEVAEDLEQQRAEDELHASIADLNSRIDKLLLQGSTEEVSSEVPVEPSSEDLERSSTEAA